MSMAKHITDAEIETGLMSAAHLIEEFGEAYWPVFERLERELNERRSRSKRVKMLLRQQKTSQGLSKRFDTQTIGTHASDDRSDIYLQIR